jgi:DNA-binding response OmpR family regulator
MTDSILLVEDDETLRSALALNLRAHGLDVVETDSCEGAVAQLEKGLRPALVLLDINLPGDSGWSLLRNTALLAAGAPPVIVTTATAVSPRRLREFNVAGYLPKPFPMETLQSTIDRLLRTETPER